MSVHVWCVWNGSSPSWLPVIGFFRWWITRGGREVLGKAGEPSRKFEWNQMGEQDPEVIIVMPCGFSIERTRQEISLLTRNAWWWKLQAVQNKQVYLVDGSSYFHRSGPRLIDGIELLAGLFHSRI